jgi:LAS superfamily LD-carboxypeptidase LdcB
MSVDDYFTEQEDMFNNMLEMQNSIKYSTMGEYFENASLSLMSNIRDTNKLNITHNTLIIKQQDTDRIEKKIEQLELQLKNYSSEEQYIPDTLDTPNIQFDIQLERLDFENIQIKNESLSPAVTTGVKPGVERYMNYLTPEEQAQQVREK